jgi:hypothetical protein
MAAGLRSSVKRPGSAAGLRELLGTAMAKEILLSQNAQSVSRIAVLASFQQYPECAQAERAGNQDVACLRRLRSRQIDLEGRGVARSAYG